MKTVMATGTFDLIHPGHGVYLEEAKKLGGYDSRLVVVIARDSTVCNKKRIPIINENQRLEMIKFLKPVDEAYLGSETDMFAIVEKLKPDIIAIGQDQNFNLDKLRNSLKKRNLDCEVKRVNKYKKSCLDSSCKIIQKIKKIDFADNAFDDCDNE